MKHEKYGIKVQVKLGQNIDNAIKKFKKQVEKYEVLDIYKSKTSYVKPSEMKRLKKKKNRYVKKNS